MQHVPIPTTNYHCGKGGCCSRTFIPLQLAYARTIHKFQGLSAGPVDKGKIKNPYECIVCDPDKKQYEGACPGLLYTATSRATTLGDVKTGKSSAIYFNGPHFKEERVRRLMHCKDSNKMYVKATKRDQWVKYLKRRQAQSQPRIKKTLSKMKKIIRFTKTKHNTTFVTKRIRKYVQQNYNHPMC
jgi:hypothetical protein